MPVPRSQIVDVIFTKGLNQAQDDRVIAPDDMAKLENAQFSKQGSIDKRNGLAKFPSSPATTPLGDTWDAVAVRGAVYEREELLFSSDKLWSLSRNDTTSEEGWVSKGLVPKGHTQRRGVARNSIQSLQQPDLDHTQGYQLDVWSEPELQLDVLTIAPGASRANVFKDPYNVLPFNRNDGTFGASSAGNLQNWPTNNVIRCALWDFETDMYVWCDECVATFATNPKVVAPGDGNNQDNIIIFYIKHQIVYDITAVDAGAATWTWTQDGVAKSYSQGAGETTAVVAAGIAAVINGVAGWTAGNTAALIKITDSPRCGTITALTSTGGGTATGPQLDVPVKLEASLVDTGDLSSLVQDKSGSFSQALNGQSLYDVDRIVGNDNLIVSWYDNANVILRTYNASLTQQATRSIAEAPWDVLAVHADSGDDEASVAYGLAAGSIRLRVHPLDLSGETGNSSTGFGSGKRFYQCSIEDSISGTDLVVAIERDHAEGEEAPQDGYAPVIEWRRFNASATEQGLLQVQYNVRLLSQLLMADGKVMANVGYADLSDLRKAGSPTISGLDFSQKEQGTAYLCDFRLDTELVPPDVLLRPMNIQAYFDTQVRRTQNHLSNFEFPGPDWGQYLSTHAFWTNPVVGRRYTAIKQEDRKPRTYSVDGIDRWSVDLGGDAHFEHVVLGNILHVADGMVFDYDGCKVVENNFLWAPNLFLQAKGSGGNLVASSTYFLTAIYEWRVGARVYRSMPAVPIQVNLGVGETKYTVFVEMLNLTYKASYDDGFKDPPRVIFYGTVAGGSIYHRLGTLLGTSIANGPIETDPRTQGPSLVTINYTDADILANERLYTDGGTLENQPSPGARLIARRQNSLYVVPEDARLVGLSQEFQLGGEAAAVAFFQANAFRADDEGDVTATAVMDEKLIIFKRSHIFVVYGDGPSPTGQGTTLTRPQPLSSDVGCVAPRSVAVAREGVFFQSAKGVYLLSRGMTITYIGLAVEDDFDGATISDAVVSADKERVHFVVKHSTDSYIMCYDGTWQQWSKWTTTFNDAIGGIDRLGTFTLYLANGDTYDQDANYLDGAARVHLLARTGWVKLGGIQGFQRVNSARILFRWGGSVQNMRVKVYRDYQSTPFHNKAYTTAQMTGLDPPQWEVPIKIQKCEAIRFEVSDEDGAAPAGTDFQLTAITVDVGLKATPKKLPNAQRG
jgi:hypothetical protein